MSEVYDAHVDLVTDELLSAPGLFDPVEGWFRVEVGVRYGAYTPPPPAVPAQPPVRVDPPAPIRDRGSVRAPGPAPREHPRPLSATVAGPLLQTHRHPLRPRRRRPSWWIVSAVGVVAVIAFVATVLVVREEDTASTEPPPAESTSIAAPPPVGTSPSAAGVVGIQQTESRCLTGSSDPMTAFDDDDATAWMCIPAYGVAGTVLRVTFDGTYDVTELSVVPGWDRINADGSDEWTRHMTAAVVEYQFNDPEQTRLTQKTDSIRGAVVTPVTPPVLASAMTITITEFGSPDAGLDSFAISSIGIVGHRSG